MDKVVVVEEDHPEPEVEQPKKRGRAAKAKVVEKKPAKKPRGAQKPPEQAPEKIVKTRKILEVKDVDSDREESDRDMFKEMLRSMGEQSRRIDQLTNLVTSSNQRPGPLLLPSKFNWKTTERNAKQIHAVLQTISGDYFYLFFFFFNILMFVRSFRTFCKFVDQSVSMETRLSNGQKILKLLYDCILRADREESTMEAVKDLQQGVDRILKDSPVKEEVLHLMQWPSFSSKKRPTGEYGGGPNRYNAQWPSMGGPPMPAVNPDWSQQYQYPNQKQGGVRTPCSFCGAWGHNENRCFTKKNAESKKG